MIKYINSEIKKLNQKNNYKNSNKIMNIWLKKIKNYLKKIV